MMIDTNVPTLRPELHDIEQYVLKNLGLIKSS